MKGHTTFTDTELINAIRADNEEVLSWAYAKYFPMILNFVVNNNGTEQDAKDIYQEAFLTLYFNVKHELFRQEAKIKTYLYAVCRRKWLSCLKERKREVRNIVDFETVLLPSYLDDDSFYERERKIELIGESMQQLGEPCRTILEDFYVDKLSMTEIAEKMGYTNPDNAKNQKYKCLQRLKKIFYQNYSMNDDR